MPGLTDLVDPYGLRARLAPALIAMLPLGLGFAAWFPVENQLNAVPAGALVALGLAVLLSQLGRDLGRQKQAQLYALWGGKPTTALLCYGQSTFNKSQLQHIHEHLQQVSPVKIMPLSSEAEQQDMASAIDAYENAVVWLLERTRDRAAFPLIAEENINYGFRRNLWALKPAGVVSAALGAGAAAAKICFESRHAQQVDAYVVLYGMIGVILFVLWIMRIKPSWVRVAGVAYAERVLLSADRMAS